MLANEYPARARVVATLPLRAALAAALLGMAVLVFGVPPAAAQEQTGDAVVAWGTQTNIPPGLGNAKAIAGGNFHRLAVKEDGTVAAWGDNSANQATVPIGLADVKAVAAGGYHSLALKEG